MIYWQNIKNPKLTGTATSKEHFKRLNALANGNLKEVPGISKEAKKVIADVVDDVKKSTSKKK